jgi:hypothetical protein
MMPRMRTLTVSEFRHFSDELLTKLAEMERKIEAAQPLEVPKVERRAQAGDKEPRRKHRTQRSRVWIVLRRPLKSEQLAKLPLPCRNVYRAIDSAPDHKITIPAIAEQAALSKKTVENQLITLRRLHAVQSSWIGDPIPTPVPSHPMRRATDVQPTE